ncbi:hypothetical protein AAKU52_003503 [Pedobacter sp. CG_S7]|uniref:hypothetical protein n=1 Tax=Pedobacter sp. CG_S7 TaxID=3143930 RepID=UPI0033929BC1
MISIKHYVIFGALLFPQQNYTRNWEGSDLPGHSFAKFEHFNGKQDFKIKLDKNDSFVFTYKTTLKNGALHLEVKSPSKTVLSKNLSGSSAGVLKILNSRGEKYKFIFKAKKASGSFDVTYKKL